LNGVFLEKKASVKAHYRERYEKAVEVVANLQIGAGALGFLAGLLSFGSIAGHCEGNVLAALSFTIVPPALAGALWGAVKARYAIAAKVAGNRQGRVAVVQEAFADPKLRGELAAKSLNKYRRSLRREMGEVKTKLEADSGELGYWGQRELTERQTTIQSTLDAVNEAIDSLQQ
jgi:hypothetical protein